MCKDPEVGDQGFFLFLSCGIGTKTLLWALHDTPGSSNCSLIDTGAQNIKALFQGKGSQGSSAL